jgi:hypothetical protein
MSDLNEDSCMYKFLIKNKFFFLLLIAIDASNGTEETLERLRNITKMFSGKDDDHQQLQKVEKLAPSEKIKNTFQKYLRIIYINYICFFFQP